MIVSTPNVPLPRKQLLLDRPTAYRAGVLGVMAIFQQSPQGNGACQFAQSEMEPEIQTVLYSKVDKQHGCRAEQSAESAARRLDLHAHIQATDVPSMQGTHQA